MPPISRLLLATAIVATPVPVLAASGISLAVAGGGIGVEPVAGMRLAPALGVHGDAALLAVSRHFQSGRAQDADDLKLRNATAMIDLFPLAGAVRLSLGARFEGAQAPLGFVPVADRRRQPRGWTSFGPAASLGWTRHLARGLIAAVEGGAMLRRRADSASARNVSAILSAQLGWRF